MPQQIFGIDAVVVSLNRAFNDQSPANSVYNNQVAQAKAVGADQFALQFGAGFATQTEDQLATKILGNLGVLPNAGLQTAVKDYLVQVGKANVGIVALQLTQILSNLETATGDQAAFNAAAAKWNNEVAASYTYSANPANTAPSPVGDSDTSVTGVTLSLTTSDDFVSTASSETKFKTTANNDTILANLSAGNPTLNNGDVIDGGAGVDTLKATLGAAGTATPTLQNIEKLFITSAGAELSIATATGVTEAWFDASTAAATISGINLATTVGISNTGATGYAQTFTFAGASGAADTANLVLADSNGAAEAIITGIETLNVKSTAGTVATTTVNTAKISADLAEKIVITGDQGLTTTVVGANVTAIDASALTKALGLTFTTTAGTAVAVTGGVGADTYTITDVAGSGKVTLNSGAGADTVNIGAKAFHSITLGDGADTLNLSVAAPKAIDVSTAAKLASSAIVVTDFVNGTDVLNLSGSGTDNKITLSGTDLSNVASATNLLNAAKAVVTNTLVTTPAAVTTTAFQYGGDTYVLVNRADGVAAWNTVDANDTLIKLTGVAALTGSSYNVAV